MNDKLKCRVVMLPTEKASHIGKVASGRIYQFNPAVVHEAQHLYFLAQPTAKQREQGIGVIKEGDYYTITDPKEEHYGKVIQAIHDHSFIWSDVKKIVATTDSSLGLPLIPTSFVEKYVEKQGIDEVMINLILKHDLRDGSPEFEYLVETRKDNTVICSPVKDSYTREELSIKFLNFAMEEAYSLPINRTERVIYMNKWTEENL